MNKVDNINKKTQEKLVSIIIPVYNVEKYIEKCILSILQQTYKNIEIIIVNDGSTDRSEKIINFLSKQDNRISIINKENAGVSAARNSGIEISTGEYIVFVDGDDYISDDYIDYMLDLIESTNTEFCFSTKCFTRNDENQTDAEYIKKLNAEDATALLLSPNVIVGCWNKIFKRSLIIQNNVWFSSSLFYGEGLTFITTLSQLSNSIGIGNRKVYYYRRNNEDSATTKFHINKLQNGEKALRNIENNLIKSRKIQAMFDLHLALFSLGAIVKIKANNFEIDYKEDYIYWKNLLQKNFFKLLYNREISVYRKLMLLTGCISPWLIVKLDKYRRKQISKNSVI
jgi:glycosyltransferase involved in cell wall biosynthesis